MSASEPTPKRPVKKGRSPSYPGISLAVAVERAKALYERERQHETPLSTAMGHWGFTKRSGPGLSTAAALRKFGLLEYIGHGEDQRVKLTNLALDILLDPDPQGAIQRAALSPTIHRELFAEYGADLPSDATLRYNLIRKRGFTEVGADEFIPQWKRTIDYAQLDSSVTLDAELGEPTQPEEAETTVALRTASPARTAVPPQPAPREIAGRALHLPLRKDVWATLHVPERLTEGDWDQMLRVL